MSYLNRILFIIVSCQELLRDDHEWVRLGALQFLNKYLLSVDIKAVALLASKKVDKEETRFLYYNARQTVKMLCLDLVDQIIPGREMLVEIRKEVNIFDLCTLPLSNYLCYFRKCQVFALISLKHV